MNNCILAPVFFYVKCFLKHFHIRSTAFVLSLILILRCLLVASSDSLQIGRAPSTFWCVDFDPYNYWKITDTLSFSDLSVQYASLKAGWFFCDRWSCSFLALIQIIFFIAISCGFAGWLFFTANPGTKVFLP